MDSSSSTVYAADEGTKIHVLGETGETVIYVFPSGGAQLLRDREESSSHCLSQPQPQKLLDEQLIESGLITVAQRDVALYDRQATGLGLGDILLMRGWLTEDQLSAFL